MGWGGGRDESKGEGYGHVSKVWISVVCFGLMAARGQRVKTSATVPVGARDGLVGMAGRAVVVFAGHVMTVDREDAAGYVDVKFKVDEAVKGCSKLGIYVVREWAGLWRDDAARYVAGERLLMLLTARGPSGMSAPMDGGAGRIAIEPVGAAVIADRSGVAPAEDGSAAGDVTAMMVDLRWVQAVTVRVTNVGDTAATHVTGVDGSGVWSGPVAGLAEVGNPPSVRAVLALLRGVGQVPVGGPGTVHVAR